MSIKLTDEEKKTVSVMHSSRQLERMVSLLQRQLDDSLKQLLVAGLDTFPRIQGRAQCLNDLISAFKPERQ